MTLDVVGFNSKVFYVIHDTDRKTQEVVRLPIVGGETVLDALSQVKGLSATGKHIWIARPVPDRVGVRQVLPVDWEAITEGGATNTNYQLFPGDRIYVKTRPWGLWRNCTSWWKEQFECFIGTGPNCRTLPNGPINTGVEGFCLPR